MIFTVSLSLPSVIVLGNPVPFSYAIQLANNRSAPLILRRAKLELIARTHQCYKRLPTEHETKLVELSTINHTKKRNDQVPGLSHSRDLATAHIAHWPPTFKSYCISRSYSLKAKFDISCSNLKNNFDLEVEIPEIRVERTGTGQN